MHIYNIVNIFLLTITRYFENNIIMSESSNKEKSQNEYSQYSDDGFEEDFHHSRKYNSDKNMNIKSDQESFNSISTASSSFGDISHNVKTVSNDNKINYQKEKEKNQNEEEESSSEYDDSELAKFQAVDYLDKYFYLDLSAITQNRSFDNDEGFCPIPPRLMRIFKHQKDSLCYMALCGVDISGYNRKLVDEAVNDLKLYLKICMEKQYFLECAFLQKTIQTICDEERDLKKFEDASIAKNEDNLDEAVANYQNEESQWENMEAQLDAEETLALDDLNMKYQKELKNIKKEWESDSKKKLYNKPSQNLLELRKVAHSLLKLHRFDEAAQVSKIIQKKEKEDEKNAARKMQRAYDMAIGKLTQQYNQEYENTKEAFQKRKRAMLKQKRIALASHDNRVGKLERKLNSRISNSKSVEATIKSNDKIRNSTRESPLMASLMTTYDFPTIKKSVCLELPPITPISKSPLSRSKPTTSLRKNRPAAVKRAVILRPASRMENRV